MDCDRENLAEFGASIEDNETNPNTSSSQTDIPVVSLHQTLLRKYNLSLNQRKDQTTSYHHHHHQKLGRDQPGREEKDLQMSDVTVHNSLQHYTLKIGDVHDDTFCNSILHSSTKLRQVAHLKPTSWTCSLCPLKYKRPADLNRHMKRKHGMSLMKNDKNILVPIVISQHLKSEYHDLQPLNLSLKCAFSDASIESTESMESEIMVDEDQPLDLSANKNNPIDYRQKTLNKTSDHITDNKIHLPVIKNNLEEKNGEAFKVIFASNQMSPFQSGKPSISAPAIRYRPFKCSECGRRSNWRWDLNKHIRTSNHPQAHLIELSEHVARATFHEVLKKDISYCDSLLPNIQKLRSEFSCETSEASTISIPSQYKQYMCNTCGYRSNWKCDMSKHAELLHNSSNITVLTEVIAKETLVNYEKHHHKNKESCDWTIECNQNKPQSLLQSSDCTPPLDSTDYLVVRCNSSDGNFPFSSSHTVDARKTKKFKCSACPYRSNFRSDVGRHIRHKHDRATCRIVVMSEEEAASTLGEYMDTWARKKFVPSPNKRRCLMPLSCLQAGEVYCKRPQLSPCMVSSTASAEHIKPSACIITQESSAESQIKKSKRWWKCSSCDFRDQSKDIIVQHWHYKHNNLVVNLGEATSTTENTSVDSECFSFQDKNQARSEESVQLKGGPYKALEVSQNVTEPQDEMKYFSCDVCPFKTKSRELTNLHKSYHKVKQGNNFFCTFCPYSAHSSSLLTQHLLLHEEEINNLQQDQQGKINVLLDSSLNSNEPKVQINDLISPMNLSTASTSMSSEPEKSQDKVSMFLMTNAVRTGGRTTYLCSQCPYVSCNRNDYLYHRQFHRPRPTAFKCPHCPYWVNQKRLLSQHYKVHEMDYQQKHRSQEFTEVVIKQRVEHFSNENNNTAEVASHENQEVFQGDKCNEVDANCRVHGNSNDKGSFLEKLGLTASQTLNEIVLF